MSLSDNKTNFPRAFLLIQCVTPWLFWFLSLLPLITLAYLGQFTRYLADDYSIGAALSRFGLWQAQVYWYQNWLGKFTHSFLVSLMSMGGVGIVPWLTVSSLLLWGILLFWMSKQFFRALNLAIPGVWLGVMVNIVMWGTIKSLREYQQVVFWQSGISDYTSSVIISTLLIGIFIKRIFLSKNRPLAIWEILLWFLAIFISGGCSETWATVQITIFGLGLSSYFFWRKSAVRNNALLWLFVGFLAACTAFVVIAKAPGNMHRDSVMAELSLGLFRYAITSSFWDVNLFLTEWLGGNTLLILLLFLTGFCAGWFHFPTEKTPNHLWLGLSLLFGTYLCLWAGFAPHFAVMGNRPPDRAVFPPLFLLVWAFVLLGVFAGIFLQNRSRISIRQYAGAILPIILALQILWLPARAAFSYASMIPSLRLYAQLWDERDAYLRLQSLQGVKDVVVPSIRRNPALHDIQTTFWLEGELQEVSNSWINQAAAEYYGLASIAGQK